MAMRRDGRRGAAGALGLAAVLALSACGSDSNLNLDGNTASCGGGGGTRIRGVVTMPNGRVASAPTVWERLARLAGGTADALSGDARPVGASVVVELVQLRPEDLASGNAPARLEYARTNGKGEYCVALRPDTDQNTCRYLVQAGSTEDHTRTRAFVFATDRAIDIDYRSEAAVEVVLSQIPTAGLCDFDPDELGAIYQAVLDAPGVVVAGNAAEANAAAATFASADAGVRNALVAAVGHISTPPPVDTPSGSATATSGPPGTATFTARPVGTSTPRPTRTSKPNTPTASAAATRPVPTVTGTAGGATGTATAPSTATATRSGATSTPTASVAVATPTPTTAASAPTNTPTPTTVPGTPGAGLGERVFTIREDSMFPGTNPRSGFFSSGLVGNSVSDALSSGPLVIVAGAPGADGIAPLSLKQDTYFWVRITAGNDQLCFRLRAAGSSGTIDCDGGTAMSVRREQAAGGEAPPATFALNIGADSGPGAAILKVHASIAEQAIGTICDATVSFDEGDDVYFTTATAAGLKGTKFLSKPAENFDCATWTTTNGPGMLAVAILGFDARAGGDTVNILRIADM
jgi:hypothetical protein